MLHKVLPAVTLSFCVAVGITMKPVANLSPKKLRVQAWSSVQLQCVLVNGRVEDFDVQWIVRNRRLQPIQRFLSSVDPKYNSYILSISKVQQKDGGKYHCEIQARNQTISTAEMDIKVQEAGSPDLVPAILGCMLGFLLLLIIAVIILFYVKRWVCFTNTSTHNRATDEEANATVDATVYGEQTLKFYGNSQMMIKSIMLNCSSDKALTVHQ
ncbi:uncharacterized protein LOC121288972 [Carcharodon carcharias]|uniref:uncharacterized protein LOC121288972 n=1 Tax=Carcharodon carcharias TaxID=13397 RepID=UPI001B7DB5A2|nr:uncharacterized protein LOC121288972 [Carcharodon carcharias]